MVASPIDSDLIRKYADLLTVLNEQNHELVVVVGGGALARELIRVAKDIGLDDSAQDEIAISVSRIFAQLFLEKLGDSGCQKVPVSVEEAADFMLDGKVAVMGGLRPGMTTDAVAALVAERVKADLLVKGTDQNGVYDKDPRKHPEAMMLSHLKLKDLPSLFSQGKHRVGIHQILDPEAIRILMRCKVKVLVVNGFKPENVLMVINGKPVGTVID